MRIGPSSSSGWAGHFAVGCDPSGLRDLCGGLVGFLGYTIYRFSGRVEIGKLEVGSSRAGMIWEVISSGSSTCAR